MLHGIKNNTVMALLFSILLLAVLYLQGAAASSHVVGLSNIDQIELYLQAARERPEDLWEFFTVMPKGGSLSNHQSGALYAEDMVSLASSMGLCADQGDGSLSSSPCQEGRSLPISRVYSDERLRANLTENWPLMVPLSLNLDDQAGTFSAINQGDAYSFALALARSRAEGDRALYLEVLLCLPSGMEVAAGRSLAWNENLTKLYLDLMAGGLPEMAKNISSNIDRIDEGSKRILRCGSRYAQSGCNLNVRYLCGPALTLSRENFFAGMVMAFEVARASPRVVGVSLAGQEDGYAPGRNYSEDLKVLDFLHSHYPEVKIVLPAGDLLHVDHLSRDPLFEEVCSLGEAPMEWPASRISYSPEFKNESVLRDRMMRAAKLRLPMEIIPNNSMPAIWAEGEDNIFIIGLESGVPVILDSDYLGIFHTNLTEQFVVLASRYPQLSYRQFRDLARNSLEYSFLSGDSLWAGSGDHPGCHPGDYLRMVSDCAFDMPGPEVPSPECALCLERSEKARAQWRLEAELAAFEKSMANRPLHVTGDIDVSLDEVKMENANGDRARIDIYKSCSSCG